MKHTQKAPTQNTTKMQTNLPWIGWNNCDGESNFYLDGYPIKEATAIHYWKNGGAVFFPFAKQRMKEIDMADALN